MNRDERWILDEKYNGLETQDFINDCERLKTGEPLAYIIGSIPFLNTTIHLSSRPLIPRPETEFWVEKAIADIAASKIPQPKVLDLCAGSGCIGVAVLKALPRATVDFVELDSSHQQTIVQNCEENSIPNNRYTVRLGNLFASVAEEKYDYILSNPPYLEVQSNMVADSVKDFEPHLALYGGTAGLELIYDIQSGAPTHLKSHGVLYIEHDPQQKDAMCAHATKRGFNAVTHVDQYNVARYTTLHMAQ